MRELPNSVSLQTVIILILEVVSIVLKDITAILERPNTSKKLKSMKLSKI